MKGSDVSTTPYTSVELRGMCILQGFPTGVPGLYQQGEGGQELIGFKGSEEAKR